MERFEYTGTRHRASSQFHTAHALVIRYNVLVVIECGQPYTNN